MSKELFGKWFHKLLTVDVKNTLIFGTVYRQFTINVTADVVEFKK
jgi:hypothetical protein